MYYQFAATQPHSLPPSAVKLAIVVALPCPVEEDLLVGDVVACLLEAMDDERPSLLCDVRIVHRRIRAEKMLSEPRISAVISIYDSTRLE
jgi:hypothetical protein